MRRSNFYKFLSNGQSTLFQNMVLDKVSVDLKLWTECYCRKYCDNLYLKCFHEATIVSSDCAPRPSNCHSILVCFSNSVNVHLSDFMKSALLVLLQCRQESFERVEKQLHRSINLFGSSSAKPSLQSNGRRKRFERILFSEILRYYILYIIPALQMSNLFHFSQNLRLELFALILSTFETAR